MATTNPVSISSAAIEAANTLANADVVLYPLSLDAIAALAAIIAQGTVAP